MNIFKRARCRISKFYTAEQKILTIKKTPQMIEAFLFTIINVYRFRGNGRDHF
jgi:hypothetical protein